MKKLLIDIPALKSDKTAIGFWASDAELIPAGVSVHNEPESAEAERLKEYDIYFFIEDKEVMPDFYPVPAVEIIAADNSGGYFGTIWRDGEQETVVYLDEKRNAFYLADTVEDFLANAANWRAQLKPFSEIEIFSAKEECEKKYEFFEPQASLRDD